MTTTPISSVQLLCQTVSKMSLVSSKQSGMFYCKPAATSALSSIPVRSMSYYNTGGADQLWKTMSGVSQQGKKRGRARNLMKKKDLNRGQKVGFGKARGSWPGLTTKVLSGAGVDTTIKEIEPLDETQYQTYLSELEETKKNTGFRGRSRFQDPLERGWSGGKPLGKKFGPPQPMNKDYSFDNFDSVLLEFKTVFKMTGNRGRVRRNSILMVTGNGQGAVGYTVSPGKYGNNQAALKKATNKAGLRLLYVDRYEDRTVYHDFFTQFGKTRIFVKQMTPGHGVVAHRAIRELCRLVGIKDLYAKVEGSMNMQHIVKAFLLGLLRQKTHQALADEKRLHLVEMRKENDYFPRVVASPSDGIVRTKEEIGHNEILDFEMISFEGNLPHWKPGQGGQGERVNPWTYAPQWQRHLRQTYKSRSYPTVRHRMRVE